VKKALLQSEYLERKLESLTTAKNRPPKGRRFLFAAVRNDLLIEQL